MPRPIRNLILTGGLGHEFGAAAEALAGILQLHGIESVVSEDMDGGLAALARGNYGLLTVYALRWRMTNDEKYAAGRARWAYQMPDGARTAIRGFVDSGGALLGLHTAVICFDDWPEWRDLLGAAWVWGQSSHPPYGPVETRIDGGDHPIVKHLPGFVLEDEVYGGLDLVPSLAALGHARATGVAGAGWQPFLWARTVGAGRVVFDGLGHDAKSFAHPIHRRIVARAALWALARNDEEVAAI